MTRLSDHFNTRATPQNEPIPGKPQVRNNAGGFVFELDDWGRLERFLVLGSEGGTYYVGERKLTRENAEATLRCIQRDGKRAVAKIVEISGTGRAPKNDPALFALAMALKLGDAPTRALARDVVPAVARTGTHLLHLAEFVQAFGGWGRGTKKAFARWFTEKTADELAYQAVKYQQRDGWALRDLLRLAHPTPPSPAHDATFAWITSPDAEKDGLPDVILARKALAGATYREVAASVVAHGLPREALPSEALRFPEVWDALLHAGKYGMPLGALVRNLATMTRLGLLSPGSDCLRTVTARLDDQLGIRRARLHPVALLSALLTYKSGRSARGSSTWFPVPAVVDALDGAFYRSFGSVQPTGKRTMLALDVSGSMGSGEIAGVPGLTPRVGAAAMALVTAAVEKEYMFTGFTSGNYAKQVGGFALGNGGARDPWLGTSHGGNGLAVLDITPRRRLDDVCRYVDGLPMGRTDCALPMLYARAAKLAIDTFVIYTDNETWAGQVHASQALRDYRQASGIPARMVVVAMTATSFTVADPSDSGSLDVVGFDTATPHVISDFSRGGAAETLDGAEVDD